MIGGDLTQITDEEARALARWARAGDRDVGDKLILSHMWAVRLAASRARNLPVPWDELVEVGTLALVELAREWDLSHPVKFRRCVGIRARWAMALEARERCSAVSMPVECRFARDDERDERRLGRAVLDAAIAGRRPVARPDSTPGGPPLADVARAHPAPSRESRVAAVARRARLAAAIDEHLKALRPEQRAVLALYHGLGGEALGVPEIAARLGRDESGVRDSLAAAWRILRDRMARTEDAPPGVPAPDGSPPRYVGRPASVKLRKVASHPSIYRTRSETFVAKVRVGLGDARSFARLGPFRTIEEAIAAWDARVAEREAARPRRTRTGGSPRSGNPARGGGSGSTG